MATGRQKILSLLTASVMLTGFITPFKKTFSVKAVNIKKENIISVNSVLPEDAKKILNGEAVLSPIDTAELSKVTNIYNDSYPEKFDMREAGLVSAIRFQGNYGTCWAFSAIAAIESALIKDNPFIDLSEWHLAFFNSSRKTSMSENPETDFYNSGGHIAFSTSVLSQWTGPVSESVLPYDTKDVDLELKNKSEYHLQDSYLLNAYSLSKVSPKDILNFSKDEIKYFLMNGKAVSISYRHENDYNPKTFAQYSPNKGTPNHAVAIVGWDDSFSRDNFLKKPESDGAWLVKNSWGDDWGNNGYFWLSYEDKTITNTSCSEVESASNYSHNYQHDTLAFTASVTADNTDRKSSYMANIFTAEESEYITAAGFYTTDNNAAYEVTIYTDLKGKNDPTSGKECSFTKGTLRYAGYHTVTLNKPAAVHKGEKFSVVTKLTNPKSFYPIPVEASVILCENRMSSNVSDITEEQISESSGYGESFISSNGTMWTDTKDMRIENTYENVAIPDSNVVYYLGNVCLKAFSNSEDYISFSHDSGKIAYGSSVELSSPFSDEIYYTTDGSIPTIKSHKYSTPIKIPSDTVLSAAIYRNGKMGKTFSRTYSQAQSVISSLTINDIPLDLGSESSINTALDFSLEGTTDTAVLFPIGTGSITINGNSVTSGHDSEQIKISDGFNKIIIRSEEKGKKTTEYTLTVFKNYAVIDYFNETILFDEPTVSVVSRNGTALKNGQSISEYLGQQLTVTANGSTYTLELCTRLNLDEEFSELFISYGLEILTDIFSVSSSMEFSTSPDMSHPEKIDNRRYTVLSDDYFRIYPNYDHELYFQVPATAVSPASTVYHITIPERNDISDDSYTIDEIGEDHIVFTINESDNIIVEYNLELKTYADDPNKHTVEFNDKCKSNRTVIENLAPGQNYILRLKYNNPKESFATNVKCIEITTNGETSVCSFDYEKENIIFNDELYTITANDGTKFSCYDNISKYIGTVITITDSKKNISSMQIPNRPVLGKLEIDYKSSKILHTFDKTIKFTRLTQRGTSSSFPISAEYIFDKEGNIYIDKLFSQGYSSGDTLFFFIANTESSFSSEKIPFIIPPFPETPKELLKVLKYTDTQIILQAHDNLEYGIRQRYTSRFAWQDSPVFAELSPDTNYLLAVRIKSTDNSIFTQNTYNSIKTLPSQYTAGDMNNDNVISASDLFILKKTILVSITPNSYQLRCADINNDGTINIIDFMQLAKKIISQ